MGETVVFAAACFLVDLEEILRHVAASWEDYKAGNADLLCTTALTNACAQHAEHVAVSLELLHPSLNTLEHIVTAAYLSEDVAYLQQLFALQFGDALAVISDIVFGDPESTKMLCTRTHNGIQFAIQAILIDQPGSNQYAYLTMACAHLKSHASMLRFSLSELDTSRIVCSVAKTAVMALGLKKDGHMDCNFLHGRDGILCISGLVQRWCAGGMFSTKAYNYWPKVGSYGPEWDEDENPAHGVSESMEYFNNALPAWLFFAEIELMSSRGDRAEIPELTMDALMPMWRQLQMAMKRGRHSITLTIYLHMALLSLVHVNGDKRCRHLKSHCRAALAKAREQAGRARVRLAYPQP